MGADAPRGAPTIAQREWPPSGAAASARRTPGSAEFAGRRSPARRGGDPARDVHEQPAARPGTGGCRRSRARLRGRGPPRRPGLPRPERGRRGRGRAARIAGQLGRRRRADHEAGPVREPRCRHASRHPAMERLGGRADRRIRRNDEVLQLARARVRGPAEHVGEALRAGEERRERAQPEVRVDGHGVGPERVEEGGRLARDGRLRRRPASRRRSRGPPVDGRRAPAPAPRCPLRRRPRRRRGSA